MNFQKKLGFNGFNGQSNHNSTPQSSQPAAFVNESNFSSVFGHSEPVGM